MNEHFDIAATKISMIMGVLGWISLTQANEVSKLVLTWITIISFAIVIIINIDKAESQLRKWFKKSKKK